MSRRRNRGDEPTLFDLPLDGPAEEPPAEAPSQTPSGAEPGAERDAASEPETAAPAAGPAPSRERPLLPFDHAPAAHPEPALPVREPVAPAEPPHRAPEAAPLSVRYLAGLADLAVHAALAIALLFGARLLGVLAGLEDWLPITLFLLVFSFFYTVLPLAFWGQTPGMAWAGVAARASAGESLTFPQTALRWLGGLLTVCLVGLPVLLAIGGRRSLADRLSDADTVLVD